MRRAALGALLAHWRRAPLQLLALLGGLVLATALWSAVQVINAEARASYGQAAATLGQQQPARLVARDGGTIAQSDLLTLARAGWRVSPLVEGTIAGIHLIGAEPLTAPTGTAPVEAAEGGGALAGFILPPGEIHARADVLAELAEVSGPRHVIDDRVAPGVALVDIGDAQRLLAMAGRLSAALLAPDAAQPMGRPDLATIAPHLRLQAAAQSVDLSGLTRSFHLNLTAFGFLAFAVGLFIVQGAVALALAQRRGTIRTLRTLGVSLRQVMMLLAGELLLAALLAGAVGVAMGQGVAVLLMPDVAQSLDALYGAEVAPAPALRPAVWLAALGMSILGTFVAGAGTLWQAARLPVLADPLRGRGAQWPWLAAALVLLCAAAVLAWLARDAVPSMAQAIALLVCLMGGGALVLPALLRLVLGLLAGIARSPLGQWFWADARRALPDLRLALMALLLAMATNIGVTTMVSSFRLAFEGFLDQRLVADLQLSLPEGADAEEVALWATAEGAQVLPRLAVAASVMGESIELHGLRDAAAYRDNWQLIAGAPDVWDQLAHGRGALVNEQLANRAGLRLGDMVSIGPDVRIVGIHADYGNPLAQVTIGEALFRTLHPEVAVSRLGLVLPPGVDTHAFAEKLRARFALAPDEIASRAAIRAASLAIFERTFTVTGALSVLTLAVAGFALLMSLATLATMRLSQVAPLWAMGVRRRSLALAELGRALGLAALTGALALPLGLALAWGLLAVVNVAAFGWRLPMFLFPGDWLRLFLLALLAAGVAGILPALGLLRAGPARLLRVFADER